MVEFHFVSVMIKDKGKSEIEIPGAAKTLGLYAALDGSIGFEKLKT